MAYELRMLTLYQYLEYVSKYIIKKDLNEFVLFGYLIFLKNLVNFDFIMQRGRRRKKKNRGQSDHFLHCIQIAQLFLGANNHAGYMIAMLSYRHAAVCMELGANVPSSSGLGLF
ncbi:hypothetical protein ACJX0J_031508 [Zea mays]